MKPMWRIRLNLTLWHWWYLVTCPFIGHEYDCDGENGRRRYCFRCLRWF